MRVFDRVIVLGIDALECRDVYLRRPRPLLQVESFCPPVPEKYLVRGVPLTPVIWTSMVTGRGPWEHGVLGFFRVKGMGRGLARVLYTVSGGRVLASSVLRWLGLVSEPRIRFSETVFSRVEGATPLFIPTMNEPAWIHEKYRRLIKRGDIEGLLGFLWEVQGLREEALFKALGGSSRLVFAWFDLLDMVGHWFYHRAPYWEAFTHIVDMVARVRETVEPDDLVIVVSDHGMERGEDGVPEHSKRFYISFSHPLGERIRDFTEMYRLLLKALGEER